MTLSQEYDHYWPGWQAAFKANWFGRGGQTWPVATRISSPELKAVETLAEEIAAEHQRAATATDLRHACNIVAFGKQITHKKLDDSQLDRVLALFALLTDPENLDAQLDWANPQRAVRRRQIGFLEKCGLNDGYISTVAGTKDWREFNDRKMTNLCRTISVRLRAKGMRKPVRKPRYSHD